MRSSGDSAEYKTELLAWAQVLAVVLKQSRSLQHFCRDLVIGLERGKIGRKLMPKFLFFYLMDIIFLYNVKISRV